MNPYFDIVAPICYLRHISSGCLSLAEITPEYLIRVIPAEGIVKVRVNGQEIEIPHPLSLTELIEQLHLRLEGIAVALNTEIIPRSELAQRITQANDQIEIVHPVGGG